MHKTRPVALILFPDALALDVAGPAEVFAMANRLHATATYAVTFLSSGGKPVQTASGLTIKTQPLHAVAASSLDTVIVSGGIDIQRASGDARLIEWLRVAAKHARRTCSVCTGAFVLATAGLLDGRRATTHWSEAANFAARFPRVRLDIEPIYIRDESVWTSAGVTAGIDLALALVQEDCGKRIAAAIARHLVVFMQRPGGQAQFSSLLQAQAHAAERGAPHELRGIESWLGEHLGEDLSLERLASRYRMSLRTFSRRFTRYMGMSPAKAIETMRVEAARRQLEETRHPVKRVAAACGFGDEERMRRAFRRHLKASPAEYRTRFASR